MPFLTSRGRKEGENSSENQARIFLKLEEGSNDETEAQLFCFVNMKGISFKNRPLSHFTKHEFSKQKYCFIRNT